MPWMVTAISEMCKTYQQMARHLKNVGSIHHLVGRLFHWSRSKILSSIIKRTKVECISSAHKSLVRFEREVKLDW